MNRVLWKTSSLDASIASIRYRCLIPHKYMQQLSIHSELFWEKNSIQWSAYDTLIFVKTFSDKDIELAKEAKSAGLQVVYDLCDNIYFEYPETYDGEKRNKHAKKQRGIFETILNYCDFVVVPTDGLKSILQQKISISVFVVPDGVETLSDSRDFVQKMRIGVFKSLRLLIYNTWTITRLKLQKLFNKDKFILWFGNSGFPGVFGLTDILSIKDALNLGLKEGRGKLIVCTDNPRLFKKYIAEVVPRAEFVAWNPSILNSLLSLCRATILPNLQNSFTQGKSNNRALLSLHNGVPVVASQTMAIVKIKGFVYIEDWYHHILKLLTEEVKVPSSFQNSLLQDYGGLSIVKIWESILKKKARSDAN